MTYSFTPQTESNKSTNFESYQSTVHDRTINLSDFSRYVIDKISDEDIAMNLALPGSHVTKNLELFQVIAQGTVDIWDMEYAVAKPPCMNYCKQYSMVPSNQQGCERGVKHHNQASQNDRGETSASIRMVAIGLTKEMSK